MIMKITKTQNVLMVIDLGMSLIDLMNVMNVMSGFCAGKKKKPLKRITDEKQIS
jgi:hypothetical protein